ncbi:hypothetical protein Ptr902_07043 [Pyrenophora tritici-repentis]|nr:hypothetical protein PtrV1_13130 [Pyrenophora tritici-repentis]KAI0569413.1 hypothetical protein Alg130_11657 [Pyrenophora tritici-repentis]KAI0569446.1 hypothetical protein Alg215_11635 [Pyrenophora tritici-repentis]KAI0604273.1 hypothetical protein TUN205_11481 [Pyrenophora tritici-repentis]KAI0616447.1 hypothetical protein TUN199_11560 [Pyrenophora tritici-repentis]
MRQSILTLWFTTFFTLFVPVLSCYQRLYVFYKEYQNCHEAQAWGLDQKLKLECAALGQKFKDLNAKPEMQQIFGRDITADMAETITLPDDNPNCIAQQCVVTAWRYREWQTNMENKALPSKITTIKVNRLGVLFDRKFATLM